MLSRSSSSPRGNTSASIRTNCHTKLKPQPEEHQPQHHRRTTSTAAHAFGDSSEPAHKKSSCFVCSQKQQNVPT
ncbi:hypothetical protein FQN60_008604, partial [Etheostoma spectabile]